MLAMAACALGVLAATLLEGDNLLVAKLLNNFSRHNGALYEGKPDRGTNHENFGEFDLVASSAFQFFNCHNVVGGHAVLLTAGLDDCEHFLSFHVRSSSFIGQTMKAVFLSVDLGKNFKALSGRSISPGEMITLLQPK
jgi:hypothetical protein